MDNCILRQGLIERCKGPTYNGTSIRRLIPCADAAAGDEVHGGAAKEVRYEDTDRVVIDAQRCTNSPKPTIAHHDNAISQRHSFFLIMGHVDKSFSHRLVQSVDFRLRLPTQLGVQVG
jgi:hypothetical protein